MNLASSKNRKKVSMTRAKREGKNGMGDRSQGQGVRLVADHVHQPVIKYFHFI